MFPFIFIFHHPNLFSISCSIHIPIHLHFHLIHQKNHLHLHFHPLYLSNEPSIMPPYSFYHHNYSPKLSSKKSINDPMPTKHHRKGLRVARMWTLSLFQLSLLSCEQRQVFNFASSCHRTLYSGHKPSPTHRTRGFSTQNSWLCRGDPTVPARSSLRDFHAEARCWVFVPACAACRCSPGLQEPLSGHHSCSAKCCRVWGNSSCLLE